MKQKNIRAKGIITVFCMWVSTSIAQVHPEQGFLPTNSSFDRERFNTVIIIESAMATISTIGLKYLWYKKFPKSRFHFFNDNKEWLNMDKVGHATSAYNLSAVQYNLMRWCGVAKNVSTIIAGGTALAYMSMIEISDGFSAEWGFSKGDMLANIMGTALFVGQQYGWNEQRAQLRFSYHNTPFAKYNSQELGKILPERFFKDYNGQSYWLSFNISSFAPKSNIPKWLQLDVGYGAEGMTGAVTNPTKVNGKEIPAFLRQRKLFLGVTGALTSNKAIAYPTWLNIFRIPSPVIEWKLSTKEAKGHLFYF